MAIIPTLPNLNAFRIVTSFFALAIVASKVHVTNARPCAAFDSDFNLYALGFGGKDLELGTQDKWSSTVNTTDITTTGRPPFDGPQTTCYLAQFPNAIYVLNGDKSNPSAVHIFDAQNKTWSTQAVTPGGPDPTSLVAILDHDTNVFYALTGGALSSLDLGTQIQATDSPNSWKSVGNPNFDTTNYKPTMALAQNHIHFIGVSNIPSGNAHASGALKLRPVSFFQPTPQSYPMQSGGDSFPSTHGEAFSIFRDTGVQQEFAFIPDDGSATYIINVESNTTMPLAGPSDKSSSTFTASKTALIQLTSEGSLLFLPYTPQNNSVNLAATWNKISVQGLAVVSSGNSSGNSPGPASSSTASGSGSGTPTASGVGATGSTTSSKNGELSLKIRSGVASLAVVMSIALVLL